jgi:hypothetical protein
MTGIRRIPVVSSGDPVKDDLRAINLDLLDICDEKDRTIATLKASHRICEENMDAEIATLRAALDGLVVAAAAVLASDALDPDEFLALDRALRAALATAKETP